MSKKNSLNEVWSKALKEYYENYKPIDIDFDKLKHYDEQVKKHKCEHDFYIIAKLSNPKKKWLRCEKCGDIETIMSKEFEKYLQDIIDKGEALSYIKIRKWKEESISLGDKVKVSAPEGYTLPGRLQPYDGKVGELIEISTEDGNSKYMVKFPGSWNKVSGIPFYHVKKVAEPKSVNKAGACNHEFILVGTSPFLNEPWYDCKHCGKRKEDC